MSQLKVWLTRGSIISIAPAIEIASRFGRVAILSRFVVPSEFGTAVAITVVIGTVALITDMALNKFVMIRPKDESALAAGHIFSVARGVLLSIALLVSAPIIAAGFGVPQYAASFAVIAAVPLIQSFAHLGIKQFEGSFDYSPETRAQLSSQLSALVFLMPAIYVFRDHRAIIVSLLAENAVYVFASHLLARDAFSLRSDRGTIYALLSFGVPVTLNGIGLAMVSQLDRAFVGNRFDVSTLALYAVILSVTLVPIGITDRVFGKMALSYLVSKARHATAVAEGYLTLVFVFSLLAAAYSLFVALFLDVLTPLVFGSHFTVSPSIHVLMTLRVFFLLQTIGAPSVLFSATGRTRELAILNISSAVGLIIAVVIVHWWHAIEAVMLGMLIGDMLRSPFFFIVASRWRIPECREVVADVTTSCLVLAFIASTLVLRPELMWES